MKFYTIEVYRDADYISENTIKKKIGFNVKEVTIYTRQFCGFCTAAKRLLADKNVSFTEHDATFDPVLKQEMIKKSQGGTTFPQIFVGKEHIGGCDDLFALEKSGALNVMLEA